ncbi:hypothetical protein SARO104761_10850 [Salinicoccus roseus]
MTWLSPWFANTREISVNTTTNFSYDIFGRMLLKYSLTATIRPVAVVIHATATITPRSIAPNWPKESSATNVSRNVPRF